MNWKDAPWQSGATRTARQAYHARQRATAVGLPASLTTNEWRAAIEAFGSRCAFCEQPLDRIYLVFRDPAAGATHDNCIPSCNRCQRRHREENQ